MAEPAPETAERPIVLPDGMLWLRADGEAAVSDGTQHLPVGGRVALRFWSVLSFIRRDDGRLEASPLTSLLASAALAEQCHGRLKTAAPSCFVHEFVVSYDPRNAKDQAELRELAMAGLADEALAGLQ